MAVTVTTEATSRNLTKLATVKMYLGCPEGSEDDGILGALIKRASAQIGGLLSGRVLARESVTETFAGTNRLRLMLSRRPIVSVSEVRHDGTALSADDWALEDREAGFLYRSAAWAPHRRSSADIESMVLDEHGDYAWEVDYIGGFWLPSFDGSPTSTDVPLPPDIEAAAIELVKAGFAARNRDPAIKSEGILDLKTTYITGVPPIVRELLAPWRSGT